MFWPAPANFRAQAAIIAAATLAVVGLAAFIITDVITTTTDTLKAEARQACVAACRELRTQFDEHIANDNIDLLQLPLEAQDLSLQSITKTVLRAFEGVEGGIYLVKEDRITGYASSAENTSTRPRPRGPRWDFIHTLAARAAATQDIVTQDNQFDTNYIIWAAARIETGGAVAWTARRASLTRDPMAEPGRLWLSALVFFTIIGMFGIVSIWYMLHSGVAGIRKGLHKLEDDFTYRLPMIRGDLGLITQAINGMAERRVALEAELRRQDRLAALGKVVSGVAHEVRNPLNSMKLTLQLLDRRLKKGAPVTHEIQEALREIDRLDMIVGRLLAFGRPGMINRQVQNVMPLIEQAARMVQEPAGQKKVRINIQKPEPDAAADVDGPQIVQVLINLLLNAIDASPSSGTVQVDVALAETEVRIVVTDQGGGIPEESKPHVFDAYYTTKPNGSGLGLAVSREIVANHGGSLDFETRPSGTTFILALPTDRSQPL
jgi:signal transduction histidine kinase